MKKYFKKTLSFIIGFVIFMILGGFFYHAPKIADIGNELQFNRIFSGIGNIIFIIWALIHGFFYARKNKYNGSFIIGANVAYILASLSLMPSFIVITIFALWHSIFKNKHAESTINEINNEA